MDSWTARGQLSSMTPDLTDIRWSEIDWKSPQAAALESKLARHDRALKVQGALDMLKASHTARGWACIAVLVGSALLLTACATPETTAEQIICSQPDVAADKGGTSQCMEWYSALRGPDNLCYKARNEQECAAILEEIEAMGFSPPTP